MQLLSLNLGQPRTLPDSEAADEITGIYKLPTTSPVELTPDGLSGDTICDQKHHGGPDQAVYVYGGGDYAWWAATLGRALEPGTFGENLTIEALESAYCAVGDQLHIGAVVLEVTAPRIPCGTLAARMGDPAFIKRFRAAERPGLYCRVLQTGSMQAGDAVRVEPYAGERLLIVDVFRDYYHPDLTEVALQRYLAAPIAVRLRAHKEKQLRQSLNR